jgi:gamma-D-glutamyl-L-lysine dipeptidyl-peptidase
VTQAPPQVRDAVIAVSVSTMWTSPEAPRPCDEAALADTPDPAAWVATMTEDDRHGLHGRTLTQLILGEPVLVDDIRDGWAHVIAVRQARSGLDARGYPGWVPAAHLAPAQEPQEPAGNHGGGRYIVDAMVSTLRKEPGGSPALEVMVGTELVVFGRAQDGYLPVRVAGQPQPLWARSDHLALPGTAPSDEQILDLARRFEGVPYVWGGMSPYGVDCSGLVYLAHRRFGVLLPRDTDDQEAACKVVDRDDQRPGQLMFFRDSSGRIHHVGIAVGSGQLLHASSSACQVLSEPLHDGLAAAVHSIKRATS